MKCEKVKRGSFECTCGGELARDPFYDSMYCLNTYEWVETTCEKDCDSGYCDNRPEKYVHMSPKRLEAITNHLLQGLFTDGAHHKQWELEQALIALRGYEWIDAYKRQSAELDEEGSECWDEGIPA